MSKARSVIALLVLLTMFATNSSAQSIGTAPGTLDLGELRPGNTYEAYFYVTTRGIDSQFAVEPEYNRAPRSFFQESDPTSGFDPSRTSQEDMSEWVNFNSGTKLVDPSDRNVASLDGGGTVVYNDRIRFEIDIPEDAEPGYHIGAVDLNPDLDRRGSGTSSVLNMALTQPIFFFKVPGVAERNLEVMDVRGVRTGQDVARLDFLVRNNGTVTSWVRRAQTELHDEYGESIGSVDTGGNYITPGETKIVSTEWNSEELKEGDYRVKGNLNYITGESFIDETISIPGSVEVRDSQSEDDENGSVPTWIILMLLVLLGVIMYSFEIDPLYIFAVASIIGISWFIAISGLPTYLIGVLLVITAVVFKVVK